METVFEVFAAINAAIDMDVMTQELISTVVLTIATFVAAQWAAGQITETQLRRASREMTDIAERWRNICASRARAASVARIVHADFEGRRVQAGAWN